MEDLTSWADHRLRERLRTLAIERNRLVDQIRVNDQMTHEIYSEQGRRKTAAIAPDQRDNT